jgi:acetyl esterase
VTAEYDVLRDEGLAFVDKLQQAQVAVSHLHLPDCTHGFISTGKFSPATRKRLNEVAAMLDKYAAST